MGAFRYVAWGKPLAIEFPPTPPNLKRKEESKEAAMLSSHRPPAVAGLFYPGDSGTLAREVKNLLNDAQAGATTQLGPVSPKALIVPHAGYIYSGPVAASAYAMLAPLASRIRRVILLGPTHRVPVRGLALPDVSAFATPLGEVPIDGDGVQKLLKLPQVAVYAGAHAQEHALEVQLPFLQTVLDEFSLLPLAVGMASPEQVAEVLEAVWGGDETLIVVSSDLSHYLPYEKARKLDSDTAQAILRLQAGLDHEQACGATPINGLLLAAQRHHLSPHLLDLRNSGDTAGSRDGVVGYAAFAFDEEKPSSGDPHDA